MLFSIPSIGTYSIMLHLYLQKYPILAVFGPSCRPGRNSWKPKKMDLFLWPKKCFWAELQKRADCADHMVLFFLAGANFWEKHAKNRQKHAKTRENRRKTGAFLVPILGGKLVGANFYAFCNYEGNVAPWFGTCRKKRLKIFNVVIPPTTAATIKQQNLETHGENATFI